MTRSSTPANSASSVSSPPSVSALTVVGSILLAMVIIRFWIIVTDPMPDNKQSLGLIFGSLAMGLIGSSLPLPDMVGYGMLTAGWYLLLGESCFGPNSPLAALGLLLMLGLCAGSSGSDQRRRMI